MLLCLNLKLLGNKRKVYIVVYLCYITMKKETKSLKINPILWKRVKEYCIQEDIEISRYIEGLIKRDLNNNSKEIKKEVK